MTLNFLTSDPQEIRNILLFPTPRKVTKLIFKPV